MPGIKEFSECPVCRKKGWYVEPYPDNLSGRRLHRCRYCKAQEWWEWHPAENRAGRVLRTGSGDFVRRVGLY